MDEKNMGTEAEAERKVYEVGFQIVPSVPEEKLGAEVSALKEVLDRNQAVVISEEAPKLRPLAYEMRKDIGGHYEKYRQAYFGWVKFEATAEAALRIDEILKKDSKIIRHLLIRTTKENTMTVPRIPSYKKTVEAVKADDNNKEMPTEPKAEVSESELDKAIGIAIGE